jgi:hypothetical protein
MSKTTSEAKSAYTCETAPRFARCKLHGYEHSYTRCACGHLYCERVFVKCPRAAWEGHPVTRSQSTPEALRSPTDSELTRHMMERHDYRDAKVFRALMDYRKLRGAAGHKLRADCIGKSREVWETRL